MIYIQTKQSVFPKTIYIGDRAELRCSFQSDAVVSTGAVSSQSFTDSLDFSVYDIKDISVQPGQPGEPGTYNLVISFIPWRTGKLQLPDLELEGIGTFHFDAVEVLSLVEQENISSLRNYTSPLLLPGTAYKIYGTLAALVVLLILVIRLIVKWHSVVLWIKNSRLKRRYARSRKSTIRALKKLEAEARSAEQSHSRDSELCTRLQKIMREYLELRLVYPFTKTLTSEMNMAFEKATCGLADENRSDAFEKIISVFVRTDFIRFSDSRSAKFKPEELSEIIKQLFEAIDVIEGVENA